MAGDSKVFKFNRGNKYSVIIEVINKGEHIRFSNIEMPPNSGDEILNALLDEAEAEAMKAAAAEDEKAWSNS